VAGAQMPVRRDIGANKQTILRAIDFAAAHQADVLLTPEGSLSGYRPDFNVAKMRRALAEVTAYARAAGVGLALGTCCVEDDGRCYNQIRFYDARGQILGFHSKLLRCGSLEARPKGEIAHYASRPLRHFTLCGVRVGGLICNDLWANPECTPMPDPHLVQQHASAGVKVIFHAVNGGRNGGTYSRRVVWPFHESNLRMRARSGKLWIVTVDNSFPAGIPCSAPSGVVSPKGEWACRVSDRGEQFFAYGIEV